LLPLSLPRSNCTGAAFDTVPLKMAELLPSVTVTVTGLTDGVVRVSQCLSTHDEVESPAHSAGIQWVVSSCACARSVIATSATSAAAQITTTRESARG